MSAGPQHPELLLYIAGQVDRDLAAEIAAHLKTCPECREEAEALQSLRSTMLARAGAGHVPVDDLVLHDEGELAAHPDRAASIQRHLETCADCRTDLGSLQAARRLQGEAARTASPGAGRAGPWRARIGWACLAAALLAGVALFPLMRGLRTSPSKPSESEAQAVTFAPPRRGDVDERRLPGNGPWAIRVVLPFGASPGSYLCRIERSDGSLAHETAAPLASDGSSLDLRVETLPAGSYSLIVGPGPGMAAPPCVYPFHVEGSGP